MAEMKKFKKHRDSVEFEYEFEDGTIGIFTYFATTTNQMEKVFEVKDDDSKGQLDFTVQLLRENIRGETVGDLITETKEGNIFDFKSALDEEVGKHKKKR